MFLKVRLRSIPKAPSKISNGSKEFFFFRIFRLISGYGELILKFGIWIFTSEIFINLTVNLLSVKERCGFHLYSS